MFGVGSSMFLYRNAAQFLGNPHIAELPYPERLQLENGWDARVVWSTVYAWLASDLSFPGVVLLMGVVGFLVAVSWRDATSNGGPFAVLFLAQLLMFCYYVPATNRMGQSPEQLVTFWVMLAAWGLTRRRVRWGGRDA
jgi:FtsH-binding integral membrane protein